MEFIITSGPDVESCEGDPVYNLTLAGRIPAGEDQACPRRNTQGAMELSRMNALALTEATPTIPRDPRAWTMRKCDIMYWEKLWATCHNNRV